MGNTKGKNITGWCDTVRGEEVNVILQTLSIIVFIKPEDVGFIVELEMCVKQHWLITCYAMYSLLQV